MTTTKVFIKPHEKPTQNGWPCSVHLEDGTTIVKASKNPGNDAARALLAMGITGSMTTHDYGHWFPRKNLPPLWITTFMTVPLMIYKSIEGAAKLCVSEGVKAEPHMRTWKAHHRAA